MIWGRIQKKGWDRRGMFLSIQVETSVTQEYSNPKLIWNLIWVAVWFTKYKIK